METRKHLPRIQKHPLDQFSNRVFSLRGARCQSMKSSQEWVMIDELRDQGVVLSMLNRLLEGPMQILKLSLKKLIQVCKSKLPHDQPRTGSHREAIDRGRANLSFRRKVKNRSLKYKFQELAFLNLKEKARQMQTSTPNHVTNHSKK